MKILKKPKFPKVTCRGCGCVFRPAAKDLHRLVLTIKDYACCPICNTENVVEFKEGKDDA